MAWTDPENEYEALVYIARRLSERYGIDQDTVFRLIAEELEAFDGVRLRAYVPTLIEHRVRDQLMARARSLTRVG